MKIYFYLIAALAAVVTFGSGASFASDSTSTSGTTHSSSVSGAKGPQAFKIKDRPSDDVLKKQLTPLQFEVTRKDGTEHAFGDNQYLHNDKAGIYVDVISGEPLFSSNAKYDSKTGWPSFFKPLVKENIVEKTDHSAFSTRTEVRSKHADSHLGHVFDDGPPPTGLRYCMNSAAMRFIPKEKMQAEGYGEYLKEFDQNQPGKNEKVSPVKEIKK